MKITAPSPASVLKAYCATHVRAHMLEPVELVPAMPPFPGTRMGIFRDFEAVDSFYAIKIRRDPRSSCWTTGDGRTPIEVTVAPQIDADATRIPVSVH